MTDTSCEDIGGRGLIIAPSASMTTDTGKFIYDDVTVLTKEEWFRRDDRKVFLLDIIEYLLSTVSL
jgi:hypothetical protein